jgi:hypothetical protein
MRSHRALAIAIVEELERKAAEIPAASVAEVVCEAAPVKRKVERDDQRAPLVRHSVKVRQEIGKRARLELAVSVRVGVGVVRAQIARHDGLFVAFQIGGAEKSFFDATIIDGEAIAAEGKCLRGVGAALAVVTQDRAGHRRRLAACIGRPAFEIRIDANRDRQFAASVHCLRSVFRPRLSRGASHHHCAPYLRRMRALNCSCRAASSRQSASRYSMTL